MDIFHSGSRFEPTVQIESGKLRMFDFPISSLFSQAIPPLKKKVHSPRTGSINSSRTISRSLQTVCSGYRTKTTDKPIHKAKSVENHRPLLYRKLLLPGSLSVQIVTHFRGFIPMQLNRIHLIPSYYIFDKPGFCIHKNSYFPDSCR